MLLPLLATLAVLATYLAAPSPPDPLLQQATEASARHERAMQRHRHGHGERRRRHAAAADQWHRAEDVAELAVCKFRVREDHYEAGGGAVARVPAVITEIECRERGCACMAEGEYRCTQLSTPLTVAYVHSLTGRLLEHERRDVRAGCVCAVKAGTVVAARSPAVDQ